MTFAEWQAEGTRRFGADAKQWKFVCPVCAHVAAIGDYEQYKDQGADMNSATCECIGRYTGAGEFKRPGTGPCNYAGYGLFRLSPVTVTIPNSDTRVQSFAFAEAAADAR